MRLGAKPFGAHAQTPAFVASYLTTPLKITTCAVSSYTNALAIPFTNGTR